MCPSHCQNSTIANLKTCRISRLCGRMIRPRLMRRSLALYLATILLLFFLTDFLLYQYPASRRQQYIASTNHVYTAIHSFSNMEKSVLPNQSTVILEPSPGLTCQHQTQFSQSPDQSGLFLLLMVVSSPKNTAKRDLIRSTFNEMQSKWEEHFYLERNKTNNLGSMNNTRVFQLLFFVGQSAENGISDELRTEWERYGDVVVDDMHESYLNLTVKTLRMLKWVLHSCGHAEYLVKMDDDVFLHMPQLLTFLLTQKNPYLVAGHRYNNVGVDRDPSSKWFTPESLYSPAKFPVFVAGFCYIMSMKAAQEMFEESKNLPLFHLEDVFLTGIVATEKLHYELIQPGEIVTMVLWFHYFNPMSWIQDKIIIHEVTENNYKCWMREASNSEPGWGNGWWPLLLSCL